MGKIVDRLTHAWNALRNEEEKYLKPEPYPAYGGSFGYQTHRTRLSFSNERSIISSIYNRIAIDVAAIDIRHVLLDDTGRYLKTIDSGLNNCLTLEANVDQVARAFKQDIVLSMFDKGSVAIVPTDTSLNPLNTGGYDIQSLRVGEVVAWHPRHVRVSVYDDRADHGGLRREITLPKTVVAVVENPLYSVMNEHNSTLQRLIRKLNLLDAVDEASASGKLDILVQLPYTIKTESKRAQAEQRRTDLEEQLKGSTYGIGYLDATEKITQLNRPVENNLLGQIEFLTEMLYGELGITKEVMNGTADEAAMVNYYNRTIEPIIAVMTESLKRTFLTKTARTQHQSVEGFRDPFKYMTVKDLAEVGDKLTRNEIASSNDMRSVVGWKPVAGADELRNKNIPMPEAPQQLEAPKPKLLEPPITDESRKEEPSK